MLSELRVRQLGVIDDVTLVLGPGMTALTGETGAGKTLLVEAIELLTGGRADPVLVRPGAEEARVEGRFVLGPGAPAVPAGDGEDGATEVVLTRVVPAVGRSRAYVDGRMVSLTALADTGVGLVDLHGQHAHQSLLSTAEQRATLDRSGHIDVTEVRTARRRLAELTAARAALGGDPRARAREADLLRFQLAEIASAGLDDPDEDDRLAEEEARLADATASRAAAFGAYEILAGEDGVADRLGGAVALTTGRPPLAVLHARLRSLVAELSDAADEARGQGESLEDDPERLAGITARRHLLVELRRKYGDSLTEVLAYREETERRLAGLVAHDERAAALEAEHRAVAGQVAAAEERLGAARRAAAPVLARAVEVRLRELAMPRARFTVAVGDDPAGAEVTWLLAANPGAPTLPLTKVASGGELARTMLAARLAVGRDGVEGAGGDGAGGPSALPTLVFDEVDAGIGGEAAVAVGAALAALAVDHQVLVVTHLPQVAAFADQHVAVSKEVVGDSTISRVEVVTGDGRVAELSRMLSGRSGSATARRHAAELLASAIGARQT